MCPETQQFGQRLADATPPNKSCWCQAGAAGANAHTKLQGLSPEKAVTAQPAENPNFFLKGAAASPCGLGRGRRAVLSIRFLTVSPDKFVSNYDPTIEDSYRKQTSINGSVVVLDILDTAGQEEYASLRHQWMRDREGFIIVFSLDDEPSFEEVENWRRTILRVKDMEAGPIILVGNKSDLDDERIIGEDEARALADSFGIPYIEASALSRHNVDEIFGLMVGECKNYRKEWNIPFV